MERILIIGCGGAGKSTLARQLGEKLLLPVVHLDKLFWHPGWVESTKEEIDGKIMAELQKPRWIIDGNYGSTMEARMAACDTVFFLDYPVEICLAGIRERQGKPRADMPWIETEDDEEFLTFVKDFSEKSRPAVLALLEKYRHKKIVTFHTRTEADEYLNRI